MWMLVALLQATIPPPQPLSVMISCDLPALVKSAMATLAPPYCKALLPVASNTAWYAVNPLVRLLTIKVVLVP